VRRGRAKLSRPRGGAQYEPDSSWREESPKVLIICFLIAAINHRPSGALARGRLWPRNR